MTHEAWSSGAICQEGIPQCPFLLGLATHDQEERSWSWPGWPRGLPPLHVRVPVYPCGTCGDSCVCLYHENRMEYSWFNSPICIKQPVLKGRLFSKFPLSAGLRSTKYHIWPCPKGMLARWIAPNRRRKREAGNWIFPVVEKRILSFLLCRTRGRCMWWLRHCGLLSTIPPPFFWGITLVL